MHIPADQSTIDDRINRFMARKTTSLWADVSQTLAIRLTPRNSKNADSDISYEPLNWNRYSGSARRAKPLKS